MLVVLVVVAASCASSGPPLPAHARSLDVEMREYRFEYHAPIHSGRTVVRVRNQGHLVHELVLIYLGPGVPPLDKQLHSGQRLVVPTIVSLHPRAPGRTGTFAVDLDPGRYGFVCFVQDPDGRQHALKGMNSEFRVK